MKRKKEEIDQIEEENEKEEELSPKELKKQQREEKKEKRLKKKKQDKAARWAGAVLLFLIMIVGFLLWVSGQLTSGPTEYARPVVSPGGTTVQQPIRSGAVASPTGKVIVR